MRFISKKTIKAAVGGFPDLGYDNYYLTEAAIRNGQFFVFWLSGFDPFQPINPDS
jgi:hypothetical protein